MRRKRVRVLLRDGSVVRRVVRNDPNKGPWIDVNGDHLPVEDNGAFPWMWTDGGSPVNWRQKRGE